MKKRLLIVTSLIFLILFNFQANAQKQSDMEEARGVANSELLKTLEQMPVGMEESYGFKSRREFSQATLTLVVCENIGHNGKAVFNRYRFMVSVNGEARALISYQKEGSSWAMCSFGAAKLAKEVSELQKSYKSNVAVASIVHINDDSFKGDFIKFDSSFKESLPQDGLIPMQCSKDALYFMNEKGEKANYTLQEVLNLGLGK